MTRLTKLAISSVLIGGLAACAAATADEELAATSVAPAPASKTIAHVATVKPGASVTMTSVLPKSMTSGSYQTVRLRFDESYVNGIMTVTVVPTAELSLFGSAGVRTFNMAVPGSHVWDLDVKADADGVYFLNVFAEAQGEARSFSVRLDMGTTTQKMFQNAVPADGELTDGGKVRVMEAEEIIQ